MQEYERIVDFSYNPKSEGFTIRFLDGSSYNLSIKDLPRKLQTKQPDWKSTQLSPNKTSLVITVGNEIREIESHVIHSKGSVI